VSLLARLCSVLAGLALSVLPAAAADSVAGVYQTAPKKVCFFGMGQPDGRSFATECSVGRDELTIRPLPSGYAVSLLFVFHNGHICEFAGEGTLQRRRLTAVDSKVPSCPLFIDFTGRSIRLTQSAECRDQFCGLRGGIDDTVLYRKAR
jgi:hypothetical protein